VGTGRSAGSPRSGARGDNEGDRKGSEHRILTSNRVVEDWPKLLRDVVVVTPLLDRIMHQLLGRPALSELIERPGSPLEAYEETKSTFDSSRLLTIVRYL
jgi:hypothetical protein